MGRVALRTLAFLRRYGRYAVSATALTLLLHYVGPDALAATFRQAGLGWLLGFLVLYAGAPVFFGVEVWGVLRMIGHPVRPRDAIVASANAWSVGVLTPARTGDLSLAYFLRGEATTGDLIAVVVMDKLLSVTVLAFGTVGSVYAIALPHRQPIVAGAMLIIVSLLLALVAIRVRIIPSRVVKLARQVSGNLPGDAYRSLVRLVSHPGILLWSLGLVVARWVYLCVAAWIAFGAFGAHPGPPYIVAGTMVGRLIALLPLSVGGVGLQEPVQIPIYALQGVPKETVVAVSLLGLAFSLLLAAVFPLACPPRPDVAGATGKAAGGRP